MPILRRTFLAAGLGFAALAVSAPAVSAQEKIRVVASFSILGDMVKQVGGEHVELVTLVGPDGDAHVYEPTPSDARALADAQLLVVNGLEFEGWLPRLIKSSGFKGTIIAASEGAELLKGAEAHEADAHEEAEAGHDHAEEKHDHDSREDHHAHGNVDPHAWQNLANGIIYVDNIAKGLAAADPDHAESYTANAQAYSARLSELHEKLKADFTTIPAERRKVVSSHDAFAYFGAAYGVVFVAPEGANTESEASAGDVASIIDQIREQKLSAIFIENIADARLVEQIARETGAKIGGKLYSDALSGPEGPAASYLDMFRHNATQLLGAVKGS